MLMTTRLAIWENVGASILVRATRTLCQNLGHGYDHEKDGMATFIQMGKIMDKDRVMEKFDRYSWDKPFLT